MTSGFTPPGAYWQLASGVVGPNGQQLAQPNNTQLPRRRSRQTTSPVPAPGDPRRQAPVTPPPSCTQALSHFRGFLTYQPADRYWTFQGIETGIFLVLAAALIAVTAVTLLRRDA